MNRLNIAQGTDEWLEFRKGKISASKIPIILGISPYQTPFGLFEEEIGLRDPQPIAPHMQAGLDIEEEAREWFRCKTGLHVKPAVYQYGSRYIASLDGITDDGKTILEIKRNGKENHEIARSGKPCDYHYVQIQWQMYVSGAREVYYLSYRKDDEILLSFEKDMEFIQKLDLEAAKFLQMLDHLTPPSLTDRDYVDMCHNDELRMMVENYADISNRRKELEHAEESQKLAIQKIIGEKSVKGHNFRITRYKSSGRIDYEKVFKEHNIDPALCSRKEGSVSYRITLD